MDLLRSTVAFGWTEIVAFGVWFGSLGGAKTLFALGPAGVSDLKEIELTWLVIAADRMYMQIISSPILAPRILLDSSHLSLSRLV